MSARANWRKIADRLAAQLVTHAFCGQHDLADADPDCPFCADRAAYRAYLAAGGEDQAPRQPPGRMVPLAELSPGQHLGRAQVRTASDGTRYTDFTRDEAGT